MPSHGWKALCDAQHRCDVGAPRPVSHVVTHSDIGQYRDTHSRLRLSAGSTWYGKASTCLTMRAKRFTEQITGLLELFSAFLQLLSGIFAGKNQATGLLVL